jgi:hypothetical protein
MIFGSSGKRTNHYTTKATIQWAPWGPFPGGKVRPGHDADHSPPSSSEVKNE